DGLPHHHPPGGPAAGRPGPARALPRRGGAAGPDRHRPQRGHDGRGLPGGPPAGRGVPLHGPLPRPAPRPTWEERNATVRALVERGWAHRLMLGHDHASSPLVRGAAAPPAPAGPAGYSFVTRVALPALRAAGVGAEAIDLMMREAPRRFLSGA